MSKKSVSRPGHVELRVLDLQDAVNHYANVLGLIETARDDQGRVYLKAWDEHDHYSLILREAESPGLECMAFKVVNEAELKRLAQALQDYGVSIEWRPAGENLATGERARFITPTGHVIELYANKEIYGNGMPTTNPGVQAQNLKGIHPSRLDHCALMGDDVAGSYRLFTEVLGFDLTEQVVDGDTMMAAFLSCSNKPHDVAFIFTPDKGKIHHMSFFVDSWAQVLSAADTIANHDVPHEIGPTRHGITRGETLYFFDPSGNRNEVFSGGYIWYSDRPALTWTADELPKAIFFHERKLNETFFNVMT
ncbi:catechol 2,3-dioxygenase [Acinetobacter sp. ANC 4636]